MPVATVLQQIPDLSDLAAAFQACACSAPADLLHGVCIMRAAIHVPTCIFERRSTLHATVQDTGLDAALASPTQLATLFAPVNTAFDAAAAALNMTTKALLQQSPLLTNVRWRADRASSATHRLVPA